MNCHPLFFSGHALQRMFERNIRDVEVKKVIQHGEVIAEYLTDKPYASFLMLDFVNGKPLHVVIAKNHLEQTCIVITAYQPSSVIWNIDFKTRK